MYLQLVTDPSEFMGLEAEWDELLADSSADSVFLTHAWLSSWWEVFAPPGGSLHVLLCRERGGGRLLGAFPGFLVLPASRPRISRIRFLGSEHVTSDYLACLARRGHETAVFEAVMEHFAEKFLGWDVLELTDVAETSAFWSFIPRLRDAFPHLVLHDSEKVCPCIQLSGTWANYLKTLSTKRRKRVDYYPRYLEKRASARFESITDPAALDAALLDLARLHQDRSKVRRGDPGRFISEDYARFHALICRRFQPRGWLQLDFLNVDGQRAAAAYSFKYHGCVSLYQTGLDVRWNKFSAGSILTGHLIRRAIEEGCSSFDFLRGDEAYKYDWGAGETRLLDASVYARSAAGRYAYHASRLGSGFRRGAKALLPVWALDWIRRRRP